MAVLKTTLEQYVLLKTTREEDLVLLKTTLEYGQLLKTTQESSLFTENYFRMWSTTESRLQKTVGLLRKQMNGFFRKLHGVQRYF